MRKAASMIELVVAIVVMSIAVMTLPMMLEQTQRNNEFTLQQEILLAARTKLGDTLTYRWDEYSLNNDRIVVLQTNGDSELNPVAGTIRRVGHVRADKRRKFNLDNNATPPPLAPDANIDDLDDFHGDNATLIGTAADLDYRFTTFEMNTTVVYVSDDANYSDTNLSFTFNTIADTNSSSSNIKMLTLTTGRENSLFTLRTYSSNIGESEFLRRPY